MRLEVDPIRTRWSIASCLAATVAWGLFARWRGLVGPFGLGWQWIGASYAMEARNLLRYGPVATHFAGVVNSDRVPPSEWGYYMHHPPGTMWSMAAAQCIFGETAFASKLPAVVASLAQVVLIYLLASRALSARSGLVAALMTATLPAGAYFATHGSELGPLPVCLSLLALLLDERARDRDPARPKAIAPLAAFVAAALFSWAAFSVALWIALRDLWGRRLKRALLFALAPPTFLALHLLHVRLATGSWGAGRFGSLLDMAVAHGVKGAEAIVRESGVESAVGRWLASLRLLFTGAGLVLLALGSLLVSLRSRIAALGSARVSTLFLALLVFALGYSVPFPEAVLFHSYWMLIALPLVSFCAAVVMEIAALRTWSCCLAAIGFLVLASLSTREVRALQESNETPYFEELGTTLRSMTAPGTAVLSTDLPSPVLLFYSDRAIFGMRCDRDLPLLRTYAQRKRSASHAVFAWIEPPQFPEMPRSELEAWSRDHFAATEVELPRSGRHLTLFDLSRTK